jgi:anti-anti-sigma factor
MQRIDEDHMSILVPDGDIHEESVGELDKCLKDVVQDNVKQVALDMSKVGYIYSRGIGVLINQQKQLKAREGSLYMFNLNNSLQKSLIGANLTEYLNALSSREEVEFEISGFNEGRDEASLELGLTAEIVKQDAKQATIRFVGTVDSEKDLQLMRKTCDELDRAGISELEMDFSELIYLDDLAVLELVDIAGKFMRSGGKIVLKSPNEIIRDQMGIMGVKANFEYV